MISLVMPVYTHIFWSNSPQQLFNSIFFYHTKVMENFITWHNITPQHTDSIKQDWISGWKKVGKFYTIKILYKRVQNPTYFSEWTAPVIIGYISYWSTYFHHIHTHIINTHKHIHTYTNKHLHKYTHTQTYTHKY